MARPLRDSAGTEVTSPGWPKSIVASGGDHDCALAACEIQCFARGPDHSSSTSDDRTVRALIEDRAEDHIDDAHPVASTKAEDRRVGSEEDAADYRTVESPKPSRIHLRIEFRSTYSANIKEIDKSW